MKLLYSIILIILMSSCVSAVDYSYTTSSGKASQTIDIKLINDYLTLDQINVTPMGENEGYILSMPIGVTSMGQVSQYAVIYGTSFGLRAYTFRDERDSRGVSGYFKPGDKVILHMERDWSLEKAI